MLDEIASLLFFRRFIILLMVLSYQVYVGEADVVIFVCTRSYNTKTINMINTKTKSVEVLIETETRPFDVVYDIMKKRLHWTEETNKIQTASLAEKEISVIAKSPGSGFSFQHIVIDNKNRYIIFANNGTGQKILMINLGGSNAVPVNVCGNINGFINTMVAHPATKSVYYSLVNARGIIRCFYGGDAPGDKAKYIFMDMQLDAAYGMGLGMDGDKVVLYWAEGRRGRITKATFVFTQLRIQAKTFVKRGGTGARFSGLTFFKNKIYVLTARPMSVIIFTKDGKEVKTITDTVTVGMYTGFDVAKIGESSGDDEDEVDDEDSKEKKKKLAKYLPLIIGGVLLLLLLVCWKPIKKKYKKICKK